MIYKKQMVNGLNGSKKTYLKLMIYLFAFCALYGLTYYADWEGSDSKESRIALNTVSEAEQDVEAAEKIKRVALTFDDGPHCIYTEKLLDGLKERGVKATFFLVGLNIEKNEELVKRMQEEGHIIGNHTYSHVDICKLSKEQRNEEILRTNNMIENITGEKVTYIRPPFGSCVEESVEDMLVVLWNVDPRDWCIMDANKVAANVINGVEDGDIILFHDIFETSVEAALKVIDELKAQGYEFVTVEELMF